MYMHTHTTSKQCDVDSHSLASKFTELSHKLDLVDGDGELCSAEANHEGNYTLTILYIYRNVLSRLFISYRFRINEYKRKIVIMFNTIATMLD